MKMNRVMGQKLCCLQKNSKDFDSVPGYSNKANPGSQFSGWVAVFIILSAFYDDI
jgi:hypothetical protein